MPTEPLDPSPAEDQLSAEVTSPVVPPPAAYSKRGSALLAVLITAGISVLLTLLSTAGFEHYGGSLFLYLPGVSGFLATILYNWRQPAEAPVRWGAALWVVNILALMASMACLIALKIEGLICVAMAFPVALLMSMIGAAVAVLALHAGRQEQRAPMMVTVVLLYPFAQGYEARRTPPPPPHVVTTQVHVNASPARVWQVLNQPVDYPAEVGLFFRAGVAYPTRTTLTRPAQHEPTLEVHYSHGTAQLPITQWRPERELRFAVPQTPAPMRELSPYPQVHAPHLHGYFRVDSGTFRLTPQADGTTLLEGRTVYRHSIGPRTYWQLWSDYLLDAMHQRVLQTIKDQAEHA